MNDESKSKVKTINYVDICKAIATEAHKGQLRSNGVAYITHPEEVANRCFNTISKSVAWLHDTLEDTDLTLLDLMDKLPKTHTSTVITSCVLDLTRSKTEKYSEYIERIGKCRHYVIEVKRADLQHNIGDCTFDRKKPMYKSHIAREEKYRMALMYLTVIQSIQRSMGLN